MARTGCSEPGNEQGDANWANKRQKIVRAKGVSVAVRGERGTSENKGCEEESADGNALTGLACPLGDALTGSISWLLSRRALNSPRVTPITEEVTLLGEFG